MIKILLLITLLPLQSFCQSDSIPKNVLGKYDYTDVVNVDSAAADKLYSNAKIFIVDAFKSGKDVTQMNDENAKTVAGTGTQKIYFKGISLSAVDKFIKFKFFIQCKDGRYKYSISNFELEMIDNRGSSSIPLENEKELKHFVTKNMKAQLMRQVNNSMRKFINDLNKNMSSQTANTKNW